MNAPRPPLRRVSFAASRGGTAAVEFALTATILFTFVFAALEFGRYNMILQTANDAAFEAARACIVPGATASNGQSEGLNILSAALITGGTVTISPATLTLTTTQVTASVSVPVGSNLWFTPTFCGTGTISKTCSLTPDWSDSAR